MIGRLRQVPLALVLVLVAAAISGVAWSFLKPALMGPDELAHFTYTQRIVETQEIPWHPNGYHEARDPASETAKALVWGGLGPLGANVAARPLWTRADEALWARSDRGSTRETGGEVSTFRNPPAYYLYGAVPYMIGYNGSFFDRLFLMRLGNVVLYLVALVLVWLLAGELLGRRRPLQVVATVAGGFLPMLLNVVATVDADNLLVTEWSAALYVMVLLLKRGPRPRLLAWLAVLCALSALTHGRGLPLVMPAILAVIMALARERGWRHVTPLRVTLAAWLVYVSVVLVWADSGPKGYVREFLSYVWQFYLPRLSSMRPSIGIPDYGAKEAWSDHLWGYLAQLDVPPPPGLADALWLALRLGLIALLILLIVRRRAVRRALPIVLVLGSTVLALLLALHLIAYRAMIGTPADPILTARYLLPMIGLFGVAIALVVSALPRPLAAAATGAVVAMAVGVQLVMAGLTLERFYA